MPLNHDGKTIDPFSQEGIRLKNWRVYESFDIPTKEIIDELSRFVQDPYFNDDIEKIWLFRALRRILEFQVKINRKLRKLSKIEYPIEIRILQEKLDMYKKVNFNEERDNEIKRLSSEIEAIKKWYNRHVNDSDYSYHQIPPFNIKETITCQKCNKTEILDKQDEYEIELCKEHSIEFKKNTKQWLDEK